MQTYGKIPDAWVLSSLWSPSPPLTSDCMHGFTFALKRKARVQPLAFYSRSLVTMSSVAISNYKLCLFCFIDILLFHPNFGQEREGEEDGKRGERGEGRVGLGRMGKGFKGR